jgi:hypothetical protein
MSDGERDWEGLTELAKRQDVELNDDGYGCRLANKAEIKVYRKYCDAHREWVKKPLGYKLREQFVFDAKAELEKEST